MGTSDRQQRSYRSLLAGVLLAVVVIAIGLLALREIVSRPPSIEIILPTPTAVPSQVQVHIAGEVVNSGVYTVPLNARLHEVITAAGGATDDADLNAVNLAVSVADSQRYYIPRRGEEVNTGANQLLDINVASAAQLETLPGIGPVLAQAIVTHRQENGPFERLEDLLVVDGIGPATLDRLRSLVTVS